MALVNFLRFSADSGAIISDEEYWNVFFRKRMHGDNLHSLLTPDQSSKLGIQVVYGSVGYPSVHREVVEAVRHQMEQQMQSQDKPLMRVKQIARIAFNCLQDAIRRRIDQKMEFYYGFDTSDLNAGHFKVDGELWPIQSKEVLENARKLASRETRDTLMKVALDAKAAVFGYDDDGITGYYLAGENSILGYVHEGFEAIGCGKYASGLVFGEDFKAKTIKMRQAGYEPAEGVYELVDSAYLAGEHFKEVGGNYNLVILDRTQKTPKDQYRQIFDNQARLATEIVKSVRSELLSHEIAVKLIDELVFKNVPVDEIEEKLFSSVTNPDALDLVLRGYKVEEVKLMLNRKGV